MPQNRSESPHQRREISRTQNPRRQTKVRDECLQAWPHLSLVVSNEDDDQCQLLLAAFIEKFQPADAVEHELVFEDAAAQFQLRRAWSLETATRDLEKICPSNTVTQ